MLRHKFLLTELVDGPLQDISIDKQAAVAYQATNPLPCIMRLCLYWNLSFFSYFLEMFLCFPVKLFLSSIVALVLTAKQNPSRRNTSLHNTPMLSFKVLMYSKTNLVLFCPWARQTTLEKQAFVISIERSLSAGLRKTCVCFPLVVSKSAGILNIYEHASLHFLCSIFLQCICLYKHM